ncbi:MAG: hypothetical protein WDZ40_04010 [Candidatus Spechtbacterales bacterium]
MPNQEIIDYIKKQLEEGVSETEIRVALRFRKFKEEEIEEAFLYIKSEKIVSQSLEYSSDKMMKGSEILSRSIRTYKERLGTFLGIVSIPIFWIFIILGALFLVTGKDVVSDDRYAFMAGIVAILVIIPVFILQQIALVLAIKNKDEKRVFILYKQAKDYFFKYLGTAILVGLIVFGGLLLLIIPGVIFAVFYGLATTIVVLENAVGMDALRKSKEYIKRDLWGYLSRWAFMIVIFSIFTIFLSLVLGILFISYPETGQNITDLISWLLMPIPIIYTVELYLNLKALKSSDVKVEDNKKEN